MLCTPIPALPAVGVSCLQAVTAQHVEQGAFASTRPMERFNLVMPVRLNENRIHAVLPMNAPDFIGTKLSGLIPAYTHIFRLSPVLRITIAIRIPVHALHGIQNPVRRIHAVLRRERKRRDLRFLSRLELVSARFDGPALKRLLAAVRTARLVIERSDADDAPVFNVNLGRLRSRTRSAESHGFDGGAHVVCHAAFPLASYTEINPCSGARRGRPLCARHHANCYE